MTLANYTTEVPTSRTIGELTGLLVQAGASALMTNYENGEAAGLCFRLENEGSPINYRMPCDWKGTLRVLEGSDAVPRRLRNPDQAKRVAWRVLKDWTRAQLALIEIGAAMPEQVLLPYAVTNDGRTLFERLHSDRDGYLKLLGAGEAGK